MTDRTLSALDRLIGQLDQALHTVFGPAPVPGRTSPAAGKADADALIEEVVQILGRLPTSQLSL